MKTLAEIEARVYRAWPDDKATRDLMLERVRLLAAGRVPPVLSALRYASASATIDHVESHAWALSRAAR